MGWLQTGDYVDLGGGAEFKGTIVFIFGKVGGNLVLAGGTFDQNVDLTGTQIAGELRLGSSWRKPAHWPVGSWHPPTGWPGDSTLILRNARADAIQDLSNSWPDRLDLNGFTYRGLGGTNASEKDPMIDRSIEWFEGWLRKQEFYTPSPYHQLATVLRGQRRPDIADEVLYASKEREHAQSPFLRYVWLSANRWLIGYGYHVEWALLWIVGFVLIGITALQISGEGRKNGMPYGIAYSFDMLLPIIRLRERHYQIDLGWVRYYFYLHKIMGYVLGAFLIAGISGLAK